MRLFLVFFLVAVLISGCAAPAPQTPANDVQWDVLHGTYLQEALGEFQDRYELMIAGAADRIRMDSSDRRVQRNAVLWKIRTTAMIRNAISELNASTALIDTWVCCLRIYLYLDEGDGSSLFKEHQPLAVQTAKAALDAVELIASQYIKPGEMDATRATITEYSGKHPLTGIFEERDSSPSSLDETLWKGLKGVVMLPVLPFTAPGKLREGARDITDVGQRWGDIVEDLPRETRWQAELLLGDLHEVNAVRSFLNSTDRISQTTAQLAAVVEDINKNIELKTSQAAGPLAENIKSVTDHIAKRIAQLAILIFSLAALLIILSRAKRRGGVCSGNEKIDNNGCSKSRERK